MLGDRVIILLLMELPPTSFASFVVASWLWRGPMVRSESLGSLTFPVPSLFAVLCCSPFCIALVSLGDFSSMEVFSQGHKFTHFAYFSFSNPYQKLASPFLCKLLFPPKPCQSFKLPAGREIPVSALPRTPPHCMFCEWRKPKKNFLTGGVVGGGSSCGPKIGPKSPQDRENQLCVQD